MGARRQRGTEERRRRRAEPWILSILKHNAREFLFAVFRSLSSSNVFEDVLVMGLHGRVHSSAVVLGLLVDESYESADVPHQDDRVVVLEVVQVPGWTY